MTLGSLPYADAKWGSGRASDRSAASEEIVAGNYSAKISNDNSSNNINNRDTNDWMSEEEKQEAYGTTTSSTKKTQVKLDPLQVCLFPTYLSLPETVLQDDLRENLQVLVTAQLRKDYGDDFVYFAFTDAKIDWYSGEESNPVCGSLKHVLPSSSSDETILASKQRDAYLLGSNDNSQQQESSTTPCTCALYSGATVVLKTSAVSNTNSNTDNNNDGDALINTDNNNNNATPEVLEPKITTVLTDNLVTTLRNSQEDGNGDSVVGTQQERPFYTELKGASVSWSAAQRQQGGKLVYSKDTESTINWQNQQISTEQEQSSGLEPVTAVLDENVEGPTVIDVVNLDANALNDGSDVANGAGANAFSTTRGKILASVMGALVLASLVVLFCVLRLKKKHRKQQLSLRSGEKGNAHETSTVISNDDFPLRDDDDDMDEELARGGVLRTNNKKKKKKYKKWGAAAAKESASNGDEQDDESEAAQYKNTSCILDCISVGSEWTLATGVTPYSSSHSRNNSKTMAEMLAAKETFDRDRQITLQKDMLQSEWSAGVGVTGAAHALSPPSGVALTKASGNRSKLNSVGVATTTTATTNNNNTNGANALQFEEATGQGEEIFLMQPAS